ncbi:MAG: PA14 domain-containing protein [Cyanobium sp.]
MITSGGWGDVDPKAGIGGYVTEWGKSGAEFSVTSFTGANGYENGTAPKMTINFDRSIPNDYVDIRNGNALIDIPISFGGTAVMGQDYDLTVSGGSYQGGRLYVRNTASVTLTFTPRNNSTWQAPRTITASLGADGSENIYSLNASSDQVWLFDDEPQLSLGQGAYKFVRAPYTYTTSTNTLPASNSDFNTNADVLLFDADGINESDAVFRGQGLNDGFAVRWETYIRIPETGDYVFRTTTDDGARLTVRDNNSSGLHRAGFEHWTLNSATTHSTGKINLTKGNVVWLQFDYFENTGAASAQLTWDRPNGSSGTINNEVVPASAMFLSESLAQGVNRSETSSNATSLGFQLFANKSTSSVTNVQLTATSEASNSTSNTTLAQRQTDGTKVGNDYVIKDGSESINRSRIGINGIVNGVVLAPFGVNANGATTSRDTNTSTTPSPVSGVPLRMNVNQDDPYVITYNSSSWNIAEAKQSETWTLSVYAKADRPTSGQLFIFEANDSGAAIRNSASTIQLGTEWQRYTFSYTFTDPASRYIQVRLDGPDYGGKDAVIWWDGVQVERANQASPFTASSQINRFATKFNPLDLHSGGFGTSDWSLERASGGLHALGHLISRC